MNQLTLIDHVAETTSHRDRDALDRSVVELLFRYLDAHSVTLYHLVHDGSVERLARRLVLDREQGLVLPSPEDALDRLPALTQTAAWEQTLSTRDVVRVQPRADRHRTLFPVDGPAEVTGLLEVETGKALDARDVDLVRGILKILRNQLSLLDYGERDELTGLLNRKTFEMRFSQPAMPETGSGPSERWLGLLDIDHFKTINDTYGHLFGDEVLLLMSRIMANTLRGKDRVFRFGGEEFVVMLEETGPDGARTAFERVRSAIDTCQFPQVGHVTISLGYTRILPHDVPITCMERADAALYYAKRHGRNNIREYEALIDSGELAAKDTNSDAEIF